MLRSKSASISRRRALQLSAGALLSLGLWPGCRSPRSLTGEPGAFRFIVANDFHHQSPDCSAWFEKLVAQMRRHDGAEFLLMLGDLADKGVRRDIGALRDVFSALRIPLRPSPGNHDFSTMTDRSGYDAVFPRTLNYAVVHRGWQFVSVDSTQGTAYQNTRIGDATLKWLDRELPRLDPRRPTVLSTHFPLGAGAPMRPLNADAVLERFLRFNLVHVFGGHHHGFTEKSFHGAPVVTNRCCALKRTNHDKTPEKGYWLCEARDGALKREFIEFKPATAKEKS